MISKIIITDNQLSDEIANDYINNTISEKLYLVLPFIYNLSKLVLEWKNYEVNKYPDDEYLDKLFEKATLDFKETKESFNELKAEYKQKRNE